MDIISDIIESVGTKDTQVKEIYTFAIYSIVVSRMCGAASVPREGHLLNHTVQDAGSLLEKSTLELAEYIKSDRLLEASVGLAALNSLIEVDEKHCKSINALEIILEKGKNRNIGIIGHFPFVNQLKDKARNLWVFEKFPEEGDLPEEQIPEILPQCDVIAITGVTLINHTLDEILKVCPEDSFIMLMGPSVPMSPVLFDYRIDVAAGIKIVNKAEVIRHLSQGSNLRRIPGVKQLILCKEEL